MWTQNFNIIAAISLFLIALQRPSQCAQSLYKAVRFNDYAEVLRGLNNFGQKLRITEAVWGEVRADYAKDMDKIVELYRQVGQLIDNAEHPNPSQLEAAEQLRHALHKELVKLYGEQLTAILIGQLYPAGKQLEYICDHLLAHHDTQLTVPIFAATIDAMYDLRTPTALADSLQYVGKRCGWLAPAFEAVLETQLHLFRTFMGRGDFNERYLFNAAYYLLQMQQHPSYAQQRNTLKHRHQAVVEALPPVLRQLFFREQGFCLLNRAYEEFFYTTYAIPIDERSHYAFTWRQPYHVGENGRWLRHITELAEPPADLSLQFTMQCNLTKNYLYAAPRLLEFENIVASWLGGSPRSGSEWNIQLLDGHLVFSQTDEHLLCASENSYSEQRRYVHVYRDDTHKPTSRECQWLARDCP